MKVLGHMNMLQHKLLIQDLRLDQLISGPDAAYTGAAGFVL